MHRSQSSPLHVLTLLSHMPNFNRSNLLVLPILTLCFTTLINVSPSSAKKHRPSQHGGMASKMPRPLPIVTPTSSLQTQSSGQLPLGQLLPRVPGTAGCMMTRSDGTTINLDHLCGTNANAQPPRNPGVVRANDLEWTPDR